MTKILLIDLETAPSLGYVWGKWEQDVIEFKKDWYILSFAYKWLGEKKINAVALPDFKRYKSNKEDDKELCKVLWNLFNEADIIIAHNGNSFDIKKANARFVTHGFKSPSPYKTVDTKLVAKKYFKFDSNALDELGRYFNLGRKKAHNGFKTWSGCMQGDKDSWKVMIEYNKYDITLLEQVYLKMRGWMVNHPIAEINGKCPSCQGKLHKRGIGVSRVRSYQRLQCQSCGAWTTAKLEK